MVLDPTLRLGLRDSATIAAKALPGFCVAVSGSGKGIQGWEDAFAGFVWNNSAYEFVHLAVLDVQRSMLQREEVSMDRTGRPFTCCSQELHVVSAVTEQISLPLVMLLVQRASIMQISQMLDALPPCLFDSQSKPRFTAEPILIQSSQTRLPCLTLLGSLQSLASPPVSCPMTSTLSCRLLA